MKFHNKGYSLIELLIVLTIVSLLIVTLTQLFSALMRLQQKITKTNQINSVMGQVINTLERDIRWATYMKILDVKVTASGKRMELDTLDNNNPIHVEYRYDQSTKNLYQSINGQAESPLIPSNLYLTEFEFTDLGQHSGDPGSRPLITTHLKIVSDLYNNSRTISITRDSMISNVNHDIELNAFFPIDGIDLSPTPTLAPYYSPTPTPTPSVYLPPYCNGVTSLGSGLASIDFGSGSLPGVAQGDFNSLKICGDKDGIVKGSPGSDNFFFVYQNSTENNIELTAKITEWYPTTANSRIGIMIRHGGSIQTGSPFAAFSVQNNNTFSMQYRMANGGTSYETFNPWPVTLPFWLKIIKTKDVIGNSYQMYLSYNSVTGAYSDGTWVRLNSLSNFADTTDVTFGVYATSSSSGDYASGLVTTISKNITTNPLPTPLPTPTPIPGWTPPPPSNTPTPGGATNTPTPTYIIPTYTPTPTTTPGIIPD